MIAGNQKMARKTPVSKVFGKRFKKAENFIQYHLFGRTGERSQHQQTTSKRERDEKHAKCQFAEAGAQIDDGGDWREGPAAR